MRPTARSIFSTARNELSLQFLLSRSPCSCVLTGHFVAAYPTISRRTWPIVADLTMYGWRPLLNELTSANGVVVNRASYSLFNTRSTGSDLGSGHDRTLQGLHHNGDKAAWQPRILCVCVLCSICVQSSGAPAKGVRLFIASACLPMCSQMSSIDIFA